MRPLPLSWPIAVLFWAAFAWTAAGEIPLSIRDHRSTTAPTDRGSKILIKATSGLGTLLAFIAAVWLRRLEVPFLRVPVYLAGVGFLAFAGVLRRHCFRMLGDSFTFDVRVSPGQTIVDRGAYRYVRHPSYTAGFLALVGIGVALGNWLSLVLCIVLPAITYSYRIAVEERVLIATFGDVYVAYMRRTRRLIPFVL